MENLDDDMMMNDLHFLLLNRNNYEEMNENENEKDIMSLFKEINDKEEFTIKLNSLNNKIFLETKNISTYLINSIKGFYLLFNDKNITSLQDSINYLEKIDKPNKNVCAGIIDSIPGWRCVDCSKYDNVIYCNDCYKKSKDLHKNHKVFFLPNSNGMCDCGDPDSLYTFCPDHTGPYSDQEKIDEYISSVFNKELLDKLKSFFDVLFFHFSKFLILGEKCDFFCKDIFKEEFKNDSGIYINIMKENFCTVFQNLLHFLRLITQKNLGMLHLMASYFLKNHFKNVKLNEEDYLTTHRCIKICKNNIELLFNDNCRHVCVCPFFKLFLTNYRDDIELGNNYNKDFLISFAHNVPLRTAYCILYFSEYKQILLNNNEDIISNRSQFFLEEATDLIAQKTNLLEQSYDFLYQYISQKIKKTVNQYDSEYSIFGKLIYNIFYMKHDTEYFSTPKLRSTMTDKISIMKRVIDIIYLIHKENIIESIVPHPGFQSKGFSDNLVNFEWKLLDIIEEITIFIDWSKIDKLKEIFKYLIDIILNQEKSGIKALKKNEYSYHLVLYRCLGLFINSFCFNYAFNHDCTIKDSIFFFKKSFFESEKDIQNFVDIILNDYFKLFGFIAGTKNNYFNYYDTMEAYSNCYFLYDKTYLMDFTLLKYIFILSDKNIDIISYLKISNVENVFSSFKNAFLKNKSNNQIEDNDINIPLQEKEEKNIISPSANNPNISNNNTLNIFSRLLHHNTNNNISGNIISHDNQSNNNIENSPPLNLINSNPEELLRLLRNNMRRIKKENNNPDEYNCLMQWSLLFEILILFLKDDSCLWWNLMVNYTETVSPKTKRDLFNNIKKNKYAMDDLEKILEEKLIHEIIAQGNLVDYKKLTKNIYKYLIELFEENDKFNDILDKITDNKVNDETKLFYLKDKYFKKFDINYYFSLQNKSSAQRYILAFKKDIINLYNTYYYNPSKLTFDLFEIVYEKLLLNKNNLELIINIVERLISN